MLKKRSSKANKVDELISSYTSARPLYEAFGENVSTLLGSLLISKGVEYLPLEKRTKTVESLRAKLIRPEKQNKYSALSDITDLAGIRVVAYYEKDVERICETIRSSFSVDEANSTDKTDIIDADRFGYLSKHFVVSHEERRRDLPENVRFADLKIEIQVRTVVQHAWAAIDRQLPYNNEADIPRELRRKLFRISALLELADKEFSEVHTAVTALRTKYERGVRAGNLQIEVNRDSVEVFLTRSDTVAKLRALAAESEISKGPAEGSLTELVQTIAAAGLKSIEDVDELLKLNAKVEARLRSYLSGHVTSARGNGAYSVAMSDAFLVRHIILLNLPKEKSREIVKKIPLGGSQYTKDFLELIGEGN
jgi:putative GTP pyrophosphokinase